ncbi:MAG: hypothetical protein IJY15_08825 [Thermoguttaceae bacterium]|nr:hypothetical protein [Thermoguttaceae bacterium]
MTLPPSKVPATTVPSPAKKSFSVHRRRSASNLARSASTRSSTARSIRSAIWSATRPPSPRESSSVDGSGFGCSGDGSSRRSRAPSRIGSPTFSRTGGRLLKFAGGGASECLNDSGAPGGSVSVGCSEAGSAAIWKPAFAAAKLVVFRVEGIPVCGAANVGDVATSAANAKAVQS